MIHTFAGIAGRLFGASRDSGNLRPQGRERGQSFAVTPWRGYDDSRPVESAKPGRLSKRAHSPPLANGWRGS